MRKRASAQFDYIFSVLGNRFSSVCDIGCGYGMLVATFLNAGFSVIGYEYDPLAISYCHNSKLPVTMLQSDTDLSMMPSVDVVTLSHVLEHLTSYDETIAILKNKAHYLFIEIPLYDVALAGQFIDQEGHVNFFTAESLQHFMAGKGFELLDIKRCGPGLIEFCSQRWQMQLQRKIKQCISRDYFMNCYNSAKDNGMWLRAVYKV
jgi:SAM-dependent methyltransferase